MAQIAASTLSVPHTQVQVVNGDTALQPFGMGSWASRSTRSRAAGLPAAASPVASPAGWGAGMPAIVSLMW